MKKRPKLSKEELREIMKPRDFQREVMTVHPKPEGPLPVWEAAAAKAAKKHAGEKLPAVEIDQKTGHKVESLDSQIGIQGPSEPRVTETALVRVVSNFIGQDYNLNVEPRHPKRPWKYEPNVIAMSIARLLDEVVPRTIEVKVRPPADDWEIMMYTFTVPGLLAHWNAPIEKLPAIEKRISEELQAYC